MWGGLKKRTHYGDVFRRWNAAQGLDVLRTALFKEPRPWYIAYTLHRANHLLQDHHCARLLAWSTSIVELQPSLAGKQEAYRYTQEMFDVFVRHHKVGQQSLHEYMRLCAVGKDLSSAFDWFKYWQEAQLEAHDALSLLSWLLRVAALSPTDENVEDMALTVLELYTQRFMLPSENTAAEGVVPSRSPAETAAASSSSATAMLRHFQPTSPVEEAELRRFFCSFRQLAPRLKANVQLREFLEGLPTSVEEAITECAALGWPTESSHRLFPQLEQRIRAGITEVSTFVKRGRACEDEERRVEQGALLPLRDSILHPTFLAKLQDSAARHNVAEVVALVEDYEQRVRLERERTGGDCSLATHKRSGEEEVWRMPSDPTSIAFRRRLVEGGGVTPELYHYLITALAATQPSAALRTLQRMEGAQLRPLDVTRATVLVAIHDSAEDRRRLFQQQLDEVRLRARLDEDHNTVKVVEAYWKCDYADFFHYRNALAKDDFYEFLLHRLGPQRLQQLLLDAHAHGPTAISEDLVLLDEDLRAASCRYFRAQVGRSAVQQALDDISAYMPKLDIGLVGTVPHFDGYFMDADDSIAHSEAALRALVQPYEAIYVLDTSFVETSEAFLTVGAGSSCLVLVPYLCLSQLAESVANADRFVTFDPALQQATRAEPFLASQRLRGLFAMVAAPATPQPSGVGRRVRVLHLAECICANQVDPQALNALGLSPSSNDDDQLLLLLAMLSSLKASKARLVLCTDDAQLVKQLARLQSSSLYGSAVEVMSTAPPANLDLEHGLIDDNPVIRGSNEWCTSEAFEPRLRIPADVPALTEAKDNAVAGENSVGSDSTVIDRDTTAISPPAARSGVDAGAPFNLRKEHRDADSKDMNSAWLELLEGEEEETAEEVETAETHASLEATTKGATLPPSSSDTSPAEQARRARLMDLYETPFDVVPVGVRMEEASTVGSVFAEFHSLEPEQREARAADRAAARSSLTTDTGKGGRAGGRKTRWHRPSVLEKEMLANRGASNKERFRMARQLSNWSGGRVPFNLRYRVVEANVCDPRNARLRSAYEAALAKKRSSFKQRHG
ncbi:hypothetical protein LSCM1_02347 [Leishmania martiniquensis]|uniref:Uncharacterized protein n=1 Tax=Leishmania martiniquensis TaxID=1580590 RepID=A0A836KDE8_9TRYP|nr:hypothetical protein LSCM1_02347 [Leishmania martiniquensis]